ncbi:MAG: FG-GAP repeat domain-containing protein, partial [Bacteroidales bacterium]
MKHTICLFVFLFLVTAAFPQQSPYNMVPDWESAPNSHVATGLALADINGDGWKDLIAANGNDIYRQHLVVYYNNGDGTFPLSPSWSSDDIDYHGHCAVGDIDKDGWMDIAVSVYIGPAGFSEPGKVKVYYNTGGELEATPSFESIEFYTFSCALGDADADGDLDLAVAASESYGDIWDYGKVFLNNNGQFNETPDWETSNLMGAMDVEFGDMDSNGFLDLVFICNEYPNAIYLADNTGVIDTDPDWQSSESITYNNSVDIGYFGDGGFPGFVTTGNDQLGGDGRVRFYEFAFGVPANSAADYTSPPVGYGSGVFLCDVTRDGNLDLIYGGWWHPVEIIEGTGTSFENSTAYTSSTSSVVEAIQLADLGKESIVPLFDTITDVPDQSKAIRLKAQTTERIINIYKNGNLLDPGSYCHVPNKNWISFAEPLSPWDTLIVEYEHSADPDMVITNWDSSKGNYIFYNTNVSTEISSLPDVTN